MKVLQNWLLYVTRINRLSTPVPVTKCSSHLMETHFTILAVLKQATKAFL